MNLKGEIRQAVINSSRLIKILKKTLDRLSNTSKIPFANVQYANKMMKQVEEEFNALYDTQITYLQNDDYNYLSFFPANFLISQYFRLIIPILSKKNKKARYDYEIFERILLGLMSTADVSLHPFESVALLNLSDYLAINIKDSLSLTRNTDLLYNYFLFYNRKELDFRVENRSLIFDSLSAYLFSHEAYGYAKEVQNSPNLVIQQYLLESIQLNEIFTEKEFTPEELINCIEEGGTLIITNENVLSDITDIKTLNKFNIVSLSKLSSLMTLVDFQKYTCKDEIKIQRWLALNECLVSLDYSLAKYNLTYTLNLKKKTDTKSKAVDLLFLNKFINNVKDQENIKKVQDELNTILSKENIDVEIAINTTSINNLGECYYDKEDYKQAAYWYEKAEEQGYTIDKNKLGDCYNKIGDSYYCKENYIEAIEWYRKASKQGNVDAQNKIGDCYYCKEDYKQAVEWYRKAAEQGYEIDQNKVDYYWLGNVCYRKEDYKQAVEWYQKAAEQGHADAQNKIGDCYNKIGDSYYNKKDYKQAEEWYRKAAEQGDIEAQNKIDDCYNKIGDSYYHKEYYKQATYWYEKAAEQGYTIDKNKLGDCYNKIGDSYFNKKDYKKAVEWFRKAAEQGVADAQCKLGVCYEFGIVEQDYKEAVYWWSKAAEQGHADAQNNLGYCYENGKGVKQDYKQAVKWYRKAAEQGHATAQGNLGSHYEYGKGVKQDYKQAVKWYRKAAEQGFALAEEQLKQDKFRGL